MFESLNQESSVIKFVPTLKEAVMPSKGRKNDICYDLTLVKVLSWKGDYVVFDSGVSLTPPSGYFFKIHPRSSIGKTGMVLQNSTGIIENEYTGSLIAGFWVLDWTKFFDVVADYIREPGASEGYLKLKAPFRCLQLELCRIQADFEIVEVEKLEDTERGSAGFGSSGFN